MQQLSTTNIRELENLLITAVLRLPSLQGCVSAQELTGNLCMHSMPFCACSRFHMKS